MVSVHGFSLVREQDIPEQGGRARLWRHDATGAELLSLVNDDENKVFGVTFCTPPPDSTGVAHILEHSVLCGSAKYPVKEPFVELLKGSLQTFLNAFTYPDKTCYPVASTNVQDFRNLTDVYLDAVFHPRIREEILRQEGWRMEPGEPGESGDALSFKGVVFNEMKGAYSSPDGLLGEYVQQSLFPDTIYGLDSGGDPERIPDLTFEAFENFHRTYYHPSNARFWFSGDDPEEERLAQVAEYLADYDRLEVNAVVGLQKPFTQPRRVRKTYAVDEEDAAEAGEGRSMFTLNWLLPDTAGRPGGEELYLGLDMLEHVLVGLPASPLRKALIESGLGGDLAGTGLEDELRQMFFSIGLKSMRSEDAPQVEEIIRSTLKDLADNGIPEASVEAAVNSVEFDLREKNTGRFPRGLHSMLRALTSWLYGGDPFLRLEFEAPLSAIKERLKRGEKYFEGLIRAHLLDNPSRTALLFEPDKDLARRREAAELTRLRQAAEQLGPGGLERLRREAEELKDMQEAPDPPETLALIPRLALADLAPENTPIPMEAMEAGGAELLWHDIPTDSIVYVDLGLDLAGVMDEAPELLALAPLLGRALLETGTAKRDFVDMSMRIARKTGGLDADVFAASMRADQTFAPMNKPAAVRFFLRGKATVDKAPVLLEIMRETLLEARLGDKERFRQMALEDKARMEHRLAPMGHAMAGSRLMARMSRAGYLDEIMGGITQLSYLRSLIKAVDADWPRVEAALTTLRDALAARPLAILNVTAEEKDFRALAPELAAFAQSLPDAPASSAPTPALDFRPEPLPEREGLAIPAQVNYAGLGVDLYAHGAKYHGSLEVVVRALRTGYLWDAVRVRGGAYGAMPMFDRMGGGLALVSYRDPHIRRTLDVFRKTAEHLESARLDKAELDKAVIGAIGGIDAHLLPDAKGFVSLARLLTKDTDADRQRMRQEVLGASEADFHAAGQALAAALADAKVTVLGGREALKRAAKAEGLEVRQVV